MVRPPKNRRRFNSLLKLAGELDRMYAFNERAKRKVDHYYVEQPHYALLTDGDPLPGGFKFVEGRVTYNRCTLLPAPYSAA